MIPRLFEGTATVFNTNGIGALTDCIDCKATEEGKGIFVLEMKYPVTGIHYEDIKITNIIVAKPNQLQDKQAFTIEKISRPINGIVTVYCNHISYGQSYIPVAPFNANGITATMQGLLDNSLVTNPYTFTTDLTNEQSLFNLTAPSSLRRCLGGMEGSVSDVFSGSSGVEFLWDNYNTFITLNRGHNNGVSLRFRKNITELDQTLSIEDLVTGVLPTWSNSDNTVNLYGEIQYSPYVSNYPTPRVEIIDLTGEFAEGVTPTLAMLNQAGQKYINSNNVGLPNNNIKLSFVDLSAVELPYKMLAENINLYDLVHIYYEPLGIEYNAKVIKTVWDVLRNRYTEIEVGNIKNNIAQTIADNIGNISELHLTNNKLISVTQTLDYEMGEFQRTISAVEGYVYGDDDNIGIAQMIENSATQVRQDAEEISATATRAIYDDLGNRVEDLETTVSITVDGVKISQSQQGSYVLITASGMEIYVDGQKTAYATKDGFNASTFITGKWHIQPMNSGYSLGDFRRDD